MRSLAVLLWIGLFWSVGASAELVPVEIDIAPYDPTNVIDLRSREPLEVAILGSESVDVTELDPDSMVFGPDAARPIVPGWILQRVSRRDVNEDGFEDLVVPFRVQDTGLAVGDRGAWLSGSGTRVSVIGFGGLAIKVDSVWSCGIGFELAFLLPPLLAVRRRLRR